MRLTITSVDDGPMELHQQLPVVIDLVREMRGEDRRDYWLGALRRPLRWVVDGGEQEITHVVVGARYAGDRVRAGADGLVIGISYVTDPSLLADQRLRFEKCAYVAIGVCDVEAATPPQV